ncbi:uncharacterized protein LOC106475488 isoform X1 [Limulus polyphemus]|uniref:Uncharacterized protein LOC106475488 isoform X1 n=1 Tax=Limulus polyphemus TaxID=6850 RepID=A0ABM1RYH3_LIMPO|nr:uncharacterized protein LOC106475488 isoform X1 [Limulus polyphemus]
MGSKIWLLMLMISVSALSTANVISKPKCYQCTVEDNSLCTDDFLQSCPDDQAYDRCMTIIKKSKSSLIIEKKCALGPCKLRDPKQSTGLGLDHCDRSKPEYSCVQCCQGDGCNKDGVDSIQPSFIALSFLLILTLGMFLFLFG